MTYETVARFAQQGGSIYFLLIFLGGFAYAVWPRKNDDFEHVARLPLDEEE